MRSSPVFELSPPFPSFGSVEETPEMSELSPLLSSLQR